MVNDLLSALLKGESKKALECIKELEIKGTNLVQFTNFTLEILRGVLVSKISNEDITKEYPFAKDLTIKEILSLIKEFLDVGRNLKTTTNQILIFQMLIPIFSEDTKQEGDSTIKRESKRSSTILEGKSEKIEVIHSDVVHLEIDEVKENWKRVVNSIRPINTHLYAFLNSSKPVKVKRNELFIEVPFKFYKDQIESPASRDVISEIVFKIFGTHCKLSCCVNENTKPKLQSSADVVLQNVPEKSKKEEGIDIEAVFAGM